MTTCSICGESARSRPVRARSDKELTLWHCTPCDFDFLVHDPSRDLAANKLDDSRLKAGGLDIPTRERDFANGLAQSQDYIAEYLTAPSRGTNVLEVGCSWGYFLKLARDVGASPYGVELNTLRARYVNEELKIPCDTNLEACESRGLRFRKIFLFYVLEYVPEPAAFLQRLVDMLDGNGELVVLTPNLHDALKDLWRNEGFRRFFYDEHAINYLSPRAVERLVAKLHKRSAVITTRQGYSVVNHCSWFLTNAPRTTGVVGGDNFVRDILAQLGDDASPEGSRARRALAPQLAELIAACDRQYRSVLEENQYGNQIRLVVTK
jgi:2-polyprenyl-3-methyl-5-hydroxy-6-metoxy-1,4-benzoquinol methylase